MLIMKFGGTSVSSPETLLTICSLTHNNLEKQPIIVVSALSKVTDNLIKISKAENFSCLEDTLNEIADKHQELIAQIADVLTIQKVMTYINSCLDEIKRIIQEYRLNLEQYPNPLRLQDRVISFGEKMSSYLVAAVIRYKTKIDAIQILSTSCIVTNRKFGGADYAENATKRNTKATLLPLIKQNIVPIVTGFIGATVDGEITTLGRGGSDYSASILGHALGATEIQIWTDVDGVYTADPRKVASARLLPLLAYEEASELASLGAKVLHPRTIKPAILANIPVKVLNTFNPASSGTTIIADAKENLHYKVRAITSRKIVPLITIKSNDMLFGKGFLKKIFTIFANCNISVSLLSVSEVSVSVTLDNTDNLDIALTKLAKLGTIKYETGYGSLSLVGLQIMETPNLMKDIFTILETAKIKVHMLSYSASNINISMVMLCADIDRALKLLHDKLVDNQPG